MSDHGPMAGPMAVVLLAAGGLLLVYNALSSEAERKKAEEKAKIERIETERKARMEAEKARIEVERKARIEAERKAKIEAEKAIRIAQEEAKRPTFWDNRKILLGSEEKAKKGSILIHEDLRNELPNLGRPINVLLIGTQNAGKSTLAASFCFAWNGQRPCMPPAAQPNSLAEGTLGLNRFDASPYGLHMVFYDLPGLGFINEEIPMRKKLVRHCIKYGVEPKKEIKDCSWVKNPEHKIDIAIFVIRIDQVFADSALGYEILEPFIRTTTALLPDQQGFGPFFVITHAGSPSFKYNTKLPSWIPVAQHEIHFLENYLPKDPSIPMDPDHFQNYFLLSLLKQIGIRHRHIRDSLKSTKTAK